MKKTVEVWRDIEGFEEFYQVSDLGRIRNNAGKILKTHLNGAGYERVDLWRNGNRIHETVHRLVLKTFNPIKNYYEFEVGHKNHNKRDNRRENLEWETRQDNMAKVHAADRRKLTDVIVYKIKEAWTFEDLNIDKLCNKFNITVGQAYDIIENRRWKHVPWPFVKSVQETIPF